MTAPGHCIGPPGAARDGGSGHHLCLIIRSPPHGVACRSPAVKRVPKDGDVPGSNSGAFIRIGDTEIRYGAGGDVEQYQQGQSVPRANPRSPYRSRLRKEMDAAAAKLKTLDAERARPGAAA